MMKPAVKRLYNEAKDNEEFIRELAKVDETSRPSISWGDTMKTIFATVYMGWLMGRNEYDESNYE